MDHRLDLGSAAEAFRREVRAWLEANAPDPAALGATDDMDNYGPAAGTGLAAWTDTLRDAGYLCVTWPEEYGGRGLTGIEVAVMNEEFARVGVPRVTLGMAESLVGPSIIKYGTDEQKAHFLPRIVSGQDVYCQGFSEPDAGSDLASLTTRGERDGDELVITGQKVWTSWYTTATMLFCLCRTNPDVPKHKGISYVLVPLRREDGTANGVEFRPIKQITGTSHFAETFLDGARAPLFNVIGGLDNGWRAAMTTLGNERGATATTQHVRFAKQFWRLVDTARANGKADDPIVRQQLAWAYSHVEIMRYAGLRLLSAIVDERDPGPGGSISKMFWSEYERRLGEIAVNIEGPHAMVGGPAADGWRLDDWQQTFLTTRCHTIWGGTAEIQRNIVGERVLGLPREPAPATAAGSGAPAKHGATGAQN